MSQENDFFDYAPVTRSKRSKLVTLDGEPEEVVPPSRGRSAHPSKPPLAANSAAKNGQAAANESAGNAAHVFADKHRILKRGHAVSFAGLFLFTAWVYLRPYELFPSLTFLRSTAFWIAGFTLLVFIPTQLGLENRLTIPAREVTLVSLLLVATLLSIIFATDRLLVWNGFLDYLKIVAMFVVIVNVVRTEKRLRAIIFLILVASCLLSAFAINDYRSGNFALRGARIEGAIGGLFDNPNDLALHLAMMIPISAALALASRNAIMKLLYWLIAALMLGGMVATFSRGGFLGFLCSGSLMVWKLARSNRWMLVVLLPVALLAFVTLAPGSYRSRLATTSDDSALARKDDLKRSIYVAIHHPVFGVGLGNYVLYSNTEKATHNAYTQVAVELGFPAALIYVMFLITAMKRLRATSSRTLKGPIRTRYLAIGLEASLVAYMVTSFFASVAFLWYVYYVVGFAICLSRMGGDETQRVQGSPSLVARRLL